MATKPTIALARFADQFGADVEDPPGGLRDTGFVYDTPAEQGFVNALFLQLYLWALYLNDGALTGNHSITGDLEVTGTYHHGTRTISIGPAAFQLESAATSVTWTAGDLRGTPPAGSNPFAFASVSIPSGKTITAVRFYVRDNLTGANVMTGSLVENGSPVATTSGSTADGTDQTLTLSGLTTPVAAGGSLSVRVSTSAASQIRVYRAEVDYFE